MSIVSKIVSPIVLGAGAIGLALTPIAAQANTRAGDSASTYSAPAPASQPGAGRAADGENVAGAANLFALFMVGLWATGVVLAIADDGPDLVDDEPDQSPGT